MAQMDIAGAMSPEECMDELSLDRIRDKPWHITLDEFYFSFFLIVNLFSFTQPEQCIKWSWCQ